jgi:predicted aconitase with swiveling domain
LNKINITIDSNTSETILAVGCVIASAVLVMLGLAVVDRINKAQTVELYTPYGAVRSSQYSRI